MPTHNGMAGRSRGRGSVGAIAGRAKHSREQPDARTSIGIAHTPELSLNRCLNRFHRPSEAPYRLDSPIQSGHPHR
jgi:hypothetical protein